MNSRQLRIMSALNFYRSRFSSNFSKIYCNNPKFTKTTVVIENILEKVLFEFIDISIVQNNTIIMPHIQRKKSTNNSKYIDRIKRKRNALNLEKVAKVYIIELIKDKIN